MIRDVNLIGHLPPYEQNYREIREIMKAENPEFQLIVDESEIIKNNQFIETSNLVGIARFEKLLKIIPSADDTLESRISRVLIRWNDVIPYTYRAFLQKLMVLCDGPNFTINNNFNEYKMEIITHLEMSGQVDELQNLLGYIIPSNIEITSKNEIYCNSNNEFHLAAGMATCRIVELSDAYKESFDIQGNSNMGSGIVFAGSFETSDAYQEEYNVQGNSIVGGAHVGTVQVSISDNFNENVTINGTGNMASNVSHTSITGIN